MKKKGFFGNGIACASPENGAMTRKAAERHDQPDLSPDIRCHSLARSFHLKLWIEHNEILFPACNLF